MCMFFSSSLYVIQLDVYFFQFNVYVIQFFTCMFIKFELYVIKIFLCKIFSFYGTNVCYLGSCMFLRYFVYDDQFLLACYYNYP